MLIVSRVQKRDDQISIERYWRHSSRSGPRCPWRIRAGGEAARIAPYQIVGAFNLEAADQLYDPNNDLVSGAQSSFAKGPYGDRDLMLGRNLAHLLYQISRNVKQIVRQTNDR